jgi:uncharacterized damage-inducible protein DinB
MPITAPPSDEYAPFYAGYVARVAQVASPISELSLQRRRALALLSPLSDDRAGYRYAAGKWSIKELVGHIADLERIMAYRLLRIGRGDTTPLPGFDENDYVRAAAADARSFHELLDEWVTVRDATITLVRGLPDEAWVRTGTANGWPVSARAMVYIILGHAEHHIGILQERYGVGAVER